MINLDNQGRPRFTDGILPKMDLYGFWFHQGCLFNWLLRDFTELDPGTAPFQRWQGTAWTKLLL
eukprot:6619982-Karenia_brevis.AAC.1